MRGAPAWARVGRRELHRWSAKPYVYAPKLGRLLHWPVARLEERHGRTLQIRARRGVVLAASGFVANRPMMREHAPAYRGGLPLGTPGDDGSGIRLGTGAGGTTAFLGRVSVWRFLSPPSALLSGVLVGRDGRRVCDESRYGAAVGAAMMAGHGGQASAACGPGHAGPRPPPVARPRAVVPAAAGFVLAHRRAGQRGHARRGGGPRWHRSGRPDGDPRRPTTRPRPPGVPTRRASRSAWSGRRTSRRSRSSTARSGRGWPTPRPC